MLHYKERASFECTRMSEQFARSVTWTRFTKIGRTFIIPPRPRGGAGPPSVQGAGDERILRATAEALGVTRPMLPVPVLSPSLSRLWITAITGAPKELVAPLIQSLAQPDGHRRSKAPGRGGHPRHELPEIDRARPRSRSALVPCRDASAGRLRRAPCARCTRSLGQSVEPQSKSGMRRRANVERIPDPSPRIHEVASHEHRIRTPARRPARRAHPPLDRLR